MSKLRAGIIGATGMVGQRFITLLKDHPWFEIKVLAASSASAGKPYSEAVAGRWAMSEPIPECVSGLIVEDASNVESVADRVDLVFCAVNMPKDLTRALEEAYAKTETPVISNNSACRWVDDVPMLIPEINPGHTALIEHQRRRLGTKRGFIAVKPNCSIQSYVPALTPLMEFGPEKVSVCTYQAISGAGKTFDRWPEILDNVIPYIGGEEEKSEKEPLRIWGSLSADQSRIDTAARPVISAQCLRVPVSDGHMAAVSVSFSHRPTREQILEKWNSASFACDKYDLPSAPRPFLRYFDEPDRPQTRLDRDYQKGMGVTIGRLREDSIFQYKFVCLSHNTLRGAAGGGVLSAELLTAMGFIGPKER